MTEASIQGRAALSDLLGDHVVYRSLTPVDSRLPGLAELAGPLGLAPGICPRKTETDYARVVARILEAVMAARGGRTIERVVYVGDTRHNDGSAWRNICAELSCPGVGFIAAETAGPAFAEVHNEGSGRELVEANRWKLLSAVNDRLAAAGTAVDGATAVVMDMDKTLLGARGRNDRVIDGARMTAVELTLADYLGDGFDQAGFSRVYDRFNAQQYHPFTTDNQDYLAFVCLMIGSGAVDEDELAAWVTTGELESFEDFLGLIDRLRAELDDRLQRLARQVSNAVAAGDPTPFKSFRRNEFLETVRRMAPTADVRSLPAILSSEIVITHEVFEQGRRWREAGAVVLALSDKPDEASIPTRELADRGFVPLHRATARVVAAG